MSFKGKDLAYEAKEPAFLRRLKSGISSGYVETHDRPQPRPKRLKKDEDEDDGPTYVLEESNDTLSKAEYEALASGKNAEGPNGASDSTATSQNAAPDGAHAEDESKSKQDPSTKKQQTTEIGNAQKKRKAGKVIGGSDAEAEDDKPANPKAAKKPKKKANPVKISFGDEEE